MHLQVVPFVWERESWDMDYCKELDITQKKKSGEPLQSIDKVTYCRKNIYYQ